jgi:4-hydroxybenzoate polyprenyltransferase
LIAGLGVALTLGQSFVLTMLAYFIVTTAYSLYLKRQALIDICVLAGLYTARIVAGAVATGIPLSVWLLAFSIFFFFSLAAIKRQAELADAVASGRMASLGRGYRVEDLPMVMTMATAAGYVSILVMGLYVNSPDVLALYANPQVLWGVCLVLFYWINRIVLLTHRGEMHDDPVVFAATDRTSQICFALILGISAVGAVA